MTAKTAIAILAVMLGAAMFIAGMLADQQQPQHVCIPLYDETGLECCK